MAKRIFNQVKWLEKQKIPNDENEYKAKWKDERGKPISFWFSVSEKRENYYLRKKRITPISQ